MLKNRLHNGFLITLLSVILMISSILIIFFMVQIYHINKLSIFILDIANKSQDFRNLHLISPNGKWYFKSVQKSQIEITSIDNPSKPLLYSLPNGLGVWNNYWSFNSEGIAFSFITDDFQNLGFHPNDVAIFNFVKGVWQGPFVFAASHYYPKDRGINFGWANDNEHLFVYPRLPDKDGNINIIVLDKYAQVIQNYYIKTDIPTIINNYDAFGSRFNTDLTQLENEIFISFFHQGYNSISTDFYYFSSEKPGKVEHLFHFDGFCYLIGKDRNGNVYFSRILSLDVDKSIFVIYDLPTKRIIANSEVDMRIGPTKNTILYPVHNKFILESMDKIYLLDIQNMKLTNMGDFYDVIGWNTELKGYLILKENEEGELYLSLLKP